MNSIQYKTSDVYDELRGRVFNFDPNSINIENFAKETGIYGFVMESGYSNGISSLVIIADGTVSLYFSNGGAMIGSGSNENIGEKSIELMKFISSYKDKFEISDSNPIVRKKNVRFYLLTYDGLLTKEVPQRDLGYNKHELSPVFHKTHELLSLIINKSNG